MLPPSHLLEDSAHESLLWALSGAAKALVVQLGEEAVQIARVGGHVGPLTESHIVEAWRRLQAVGAIHGMQTQAVAQVGEDEESTLE